MLRYRYGTRGNNIIERAFYEPKMRTFANILDHLPKANINTPGGY